MFEPYMVRITQDLCVSMLLNIILMTSYLYSKVIHWRAKLPLV